MRRFAKPLYGLTPVPRVRIPPSPPVSLDCREFLPYFSSNFAYSARFVRFLRDKSDCRERTAVAIALLGSAFFSEGSIRSPTLPISLGECVAITNRIAYETDLTSSRRNPLLPWGGPRLK